MLRTIHVICKRDLLEIAGIGSLAKGSVIEILGTSRFSKEVPKGLVFQVPLSTS